MKLHRQYMSIALCASLFVTASLGAAIAQGELISTIQGHTPVERLAAGDTMLTQIHNCWFPSTHITAITPHTANAVYHIQTDVTELRVSGDQLLYDAQLNEWVQAKDVSTSTVFLNSAHEHIPCTGVEVINEPTAAYTLSVASPHTFYLSEANILAHNMDPIFVMDGAAKAVPAFVQTAQAIGTGIMMITSWLIHKRREKKTQQASSTPAPPNPCPEDPKDRQNENNFFKKLKKQADKIVRSKRFGKLYRDPKTKLWWSKDLANHGKYGKSCYKVFKEGAKGFEWQFDASKMGQRIIGKHKGPIGRFIPYKEVIFY